MPHQDDLIKAQVLAGLGWFKPNITSTQECNNKYTHTQPFYGPFPGLPGSASATRDLLLDFMVQGKITEADALTIWLDAIPSGLILSLIHI